MSRKEARIVIRIDKDINTIELINGHKFNNNDKLMNNDRGQILHSEECLLNSIFINLR
ncbi:MAG: hypothetical protein ACJASL_001230 [Paraglaciecola sp.]|jgi:hypothetical protein